jgi:hypothetical protein
MSAAALARVRRPSLVITLLALALACVLGGAVGSAPVGAGGPGTWTDVSGPVGSLLVQPRVARDAAGLLHVVWVVEGVKQDLKHRVIAADGTAGAQQTLAEGWGTLNNPALVYDATAAAPFIVLAGGIRSSTPGDPHEGLNWWTSTDGSAWTLQPGLVSGPGGIAYSSDVSAVLTPAGVFQTWFGTSGVWSHRGLVNGGDHDVNDVGSYGYFSSLAYDSAADRLWLAAAYNATGKQGLWVREIDQTSGAAATASQLLPQSATPYEGRQDFNMKQMPVPATGLSGRPGVVVAYPTGYPSTTQLRVWRLADGSTTTTVLGGAGDKGATAVAATADGRAWVVWADNAGGARRIHSSRSNVGATAWGAVSTVAVPPGTDALWELAASAQSGLVDVLAQASKSGDDRIYHTQLFAGLSVSVAPRTAKARVPFTATVTVRDAGAALEGARVSVGGKTSVTDGSGVARLKLKAAKAGKMTVTVKHDGYQTATAAVTVKR